VDLSERELGEAGLAEAYQRLSERVSNPTEVGPLLSLAETLEWCYSLECHFRQQMGDPAYFLARDRDPDGQTLGGLMYARGLFTHGLIAIAHLVHLPPAATMRSLPGNRGGGVMYSAALVSSYLWKAFDELPPPGKCEPNKRDIFYELHVGKRAVMEPVAAAKRFLLGVPLP
jgi:hypothetical protein